MAEWYNENAIVKHQHLDSVACSCVTRLTCLCELCTIYAKTSSMKNIHVYTHRRRARTDISAMQGIPNWLNFIYFAHRPLKMVPRELCAYSINFGLQINKVLLRKWWIGRRDLFHSIEQRTTIQSTLKILRSHFFFSFAFGFWLWSE